jgi:DNA replication protein DnaC
MMGYSLEWTIALWKIHAIVDTGEQIVSALSSMAANHSQKLYWQTSIVDLMKLVGIDPNLPNRKQLAEELAYQGNTNDSTAMNVWLHGAVMISYTEFADILLQAEADYRQERKTVNRIKAAKFTVRPAFEDFDFTAKRSITKAEIKEIHTLGWLNDARPLLLIGETGVGKTFIAQAVGLHACASGKSVLYMSITALQENLAIARSSGTYLRYRAKLAKFDLIIFDEMGMRKFTATEAQDLCEIIEERSIDKSIAFTSQLPVDHWNEVISDTVIFDAIRDRLEHSALTVNITGDTYRGVKARKLASKKKDA